MNKHEKQLLNEMEWLGIILKDSNYWEEKTINKNHFYNVQTENLFKIIEVFQKKQIPLDSNAWMKLSEEQKESFGGLSYLDKCKKLAKYVRDENIRRIEKEIHTYHMGESIKNVVQSFEEDEEYDIDVIQEVVQKINESSEGMSQKRKSIQEKLLDAHTHWMNMSEEMSGIDTGYHLLNENFDGWQSDNGDLIVVGARPSMGKTSTTINFMLESAKCGEYVIYVPAETGEMSIIRRSVATLKGLSVAAMRNPKKFLSKEDLQKYQEGMQELSQLPIDIVELHDVREIVQLVRDKRKELGKDRKILLIIDHLSHLEISGMNFNGNENLKYGEICKMLKGMNKKYRVATMLLSQLNRESAKSENKRPNLTSLRNSGEIEQQADLVIFLHRELYHRIQAGEEVDPNEKDILELIVAKNRDGECGILELEFIGRTNQVKEL